MTLATIRTIARRRLSHHDAEDVAQEVLIKLWMHAHEQTRGTPGAQIAVYTRNAVIDRLRHLRSQRRLLANAPTRPASDRADADDIARAWAIAERDPLLFEYGRATLARTSKTLGMPLSTVKTLTYRAMGRVRGEVRGE